MNKKAFTLIELLVVIAIVGILSAVVVVTMRSGINKAKSARILQDFQTIEKAFMLKALDDGIHEWWDEDEFPQGEIEWGRYVSEMDPDLADNFLPVAPTIPDNAGEFQSYQYLYDYDPGHGAFPNDPDVDCFTPASSDDIDEMYFGVNIMMDLGLATESEEWKQIFDYLDEAIDGGDGSLCGRFRGDYYGDIYHLYGWPNKRRMIYSIDFDGTVNF